MREYRYELALCPFCQSKRLGLSNKTTTSSWVRKRHVSIYCKDCNAYGPRILAEELGNRDCTDEAVEMAVLKWNNQEATKNAIQLTLKL